MAVPPNLRDYLDASGAKYETLPHRKGYTAREVADSLGMPPAHLAKTVVVAAGGKHVLAVVPATCRVDLDRLGALLGDPQVSLVPESAFRRLFPDCAIGTMPPLGGPYRMEAVVDSRLAALEQITFQAGSHEEVIRMAWEAFCRIESPRTGQISTGPQEGSASPAGTSP